MTSPAERPFSILWGEVFWNHIGPHSGLRPLSRLVEARHAGMLRRVARSRPAAEPISAIRRKLQNVLDPNPEWLSISKSSLPLYSPESWRLETALCAAVAADAPDVVVLEGLEDCCYKTAAARPTWPRTRLVAVSHQPPAWLRLHYRRPELVKSLDAIVVFSRAAQDFWNSTLGAEKAHFIPHGVDSEFFLPRPANLARPADQPLRALFCGHWLRDFRTLGNVVAAAGEKRLNVVFDLVVPHKVRDMEGLYRLAMSPLVRWHADLSDTALRSLYWDADLALLPLQDATANNGLLEGMACGLPVVITDVGGVRDYATSDFADFVPLDGAGAIVSLLERYAADRTSLRPRGEAARRHAETALTWTASAARFDTLLRDIVERI